MRKILVDNAGFENVNSSHTCSSAPVSNYFALFNYWANIPPWTIPERHSTALPPCIATSVGSPDCVCNGGHNSIHYGRCFDKEYIVAPLHATMLQNHAYYIEYYVTTGTSVLMED